MHTSKIFLFLLGIICLINTSACVPEKHFPVSDNAHYAITEGSILSESSLIPSLPQSDEFILPGLVGNNMVLQRNSSMILWGNYSTDGPVNAEINGNIFTGACINGYFEIEIVTGDEIEPFDLTIFSATEKIILKNVLLGEVFICAGQSNMQLPMGSIGAPELTSGIPHDHIRFVNVPVQSTVNPVKEPDTEVALKWDILFNSTLPSFSAVAYYFGEEMYQTLQVPIGIILVAAGDTIIASWLPSEDAQTLKSVYQEDRPITHVRTASHMFYTMLSPILKYKARGVVWYQGENQPYKYEEYLTKLIEVWRREFNNEKLAFTIIQLPGLDNGWNKGWPEIRQAQKIVSENLPNCTISINIDCGEKGEIHPKDKKPIGVRAAYATLSKFFDLKELPQSPMVQSIHLSGNQAIVEFNHAEDGLILKNGGIGFEMSDGMNFFPANAVVDENKVFLTSPSVSVPVAVRYAYENWPEVSLFSKDNLPAEPFYLQIPQWKTED